MPEPLTAEDLSGYAAGWRARDRRAAADAAAWREAQRPAIEAAARLLVEDFGARRVTLFGSFHRGTATPGSDVDLLVEGLEPGRFFDAAAAVDGLLEGLPVDLVPAAFARAEVLAAARSDGEVLCG